MFAKWASTRNKAEGEPEHFDQAAMLTRFVPSGNLFIYLINFVTSKLQNNAEQKLIVKLIIATV